MHHPWHVQLARDATLAVYLLVYFVTCRSLIGPPPGFYLPYIFIGAGLVLLGALAAAGPMCFWRGMEDWSHEEDSPCPFRGEMGFARLRLLSLVQYAAAIVIVVAIPEFCRHRALLDGAAWVGPLEDVAAAVKATQVGSGRAFQRFYFTSGRVDLSVLQSLGGPDMLAPALGGDERVLAWATPGSDFCAEDEVASCGTVRAEGCRGYALCAYRHRWRCLTRYEVNVERLARVKAEYAPAVDAGYEAESCIPALIFETPQKLAAWSSMGLMVACPILAAKLLLDLLFAWHIVIQNRPPLELAGTTGRSGSKRPPSPKDRRLHDACLQQDLRLVDIQLVVDAGASKQGVQEAAPSGLASSQMVAQQLEVLREMESRLATAEDTLERTKVFTTKQARIETWHLQSHAELKLQASTARAVLAVEQKGRLLEQRGRLEVLSFRVRELRGELGGCKASSAGPEEEPEHTSPPPGPPSRERLEDEALAERRRAELLGRRVEAASTEYASLQQFNIELAGLQALRQKHRWHEDRVAELAAQRGALRGGAALLEDELRSLTRGHGDVAGELCVAEQRLGAARACREALSGDVAGVRQLLEAQCDRVRGVEGKLRLPPEAPERIAALHRMVQESALAVGATCELLDAERGARKELQQELEQESERQVFASELLSHFDARVRKVAPEALRRRRHAELPAKEAQVKAMVDARLGDFDWAVYEQYRQTLARKLSLSLSGGSSRILADDELASAEN